MFRSFKPRPPQWSDLSYLSSFARGLGNNLQQNLKLQFLINLLGSHNPQLHKFAGLPAGAPLSQQAGTFLTRGQTGLESDPLEGGINPYDPIEQALKVE